MKRRELEHAGERATGIDATSKKNNRTRSGRVPRYLSDWDSSRARGRSFYRLSRRGVFASTAALSLNKVLIDYSEGKHRSRARKFRRPAAVGVPLQEENDRRKKYLRIGSALS